jgi:hypothetical protein
MNKIQRQILAYILQERSITWIEAKEIIGIPVHHFLEAVGELKYQRIVDTTQATVELKKGEPGIINKYTLTESGKIIAQRNSIIPGYTITP